MLRGNYTARIDSKGRLKVPGLFRRYVEEKYGSACYVTSLTGECVRIYPMPEWEAIEQRLSLLPSMDPARRKFLDRTNYYGQQSAMDTQGRVLIHPLLRKIAAVADCAIRNLGVGSERSAVSSFDKFKAVCSARLRIAVSALLTANGSEFTLSSLNEIAGRC